MLIVCPRSGTNDTLLAKGTSPVDPDGWDVYEETYSDVKITASVDGHTNIMDLDVNAFFPYSADCSATNIFASNQIEGTIEYYCRLSAWVSYMNVRDDSNNNLVRLAISSAYISYYDNKYHKVI